MERGSTPDRACLRCDNRHGCRTTAPLCEHLEEAPAEHELLGRERMELRGLLGRCPSCTLFRSCWNATAYHRALRRASCSSL